MKMYSFNFRQKIAETCFKKVISQQDAANRFSGALSFVEKLLRQLRATGNLAPKPYGGGLQPEFNTAQLLVVNALIAANNDATLQDLIDISSHVSNKVALTASGSLPTMWLA